MRVARSHFRELPAGQPYWLATSLAVAPSTKMRRTRRITGFSTTTHALTTTVVDVSLNVVKVPGASGSYGSFGPNIGIDPGDPGNSQ